MTHSLTSIILSGGLLMAGIPAVSATDKITDKQSCESSYKIVLDASEENDLGDKAEREVEDLIASMKKQCDSGAFAEAEASAEKIRGMLASEDDSGKDEDKNKS